MKVWLEELRVNGAKWPLDLEIELDDATDICVQVHVPERQATVEVIHSLKAEILKQLEARGS